MFAYVGLLFIPWLWFQYGWVYAIAYLFFVTIFASFLSLRCAMGSLLLGGFSILVLQLQSVHSLPITYQHSQVPLTICADPTFKPYDDVLLGNAYVAEQPTHLNLRRVSAAIAAKFAISNAPGLCIQGVFRVKQPFGNLLPGLFNVDKYYFSQKIDAKVTLVELHESFNDNRLMYRLNSRVSGYFGNEDHQQLWAALVLGWSSAMNAELKDLLASNQLAHMFVVSGFHIGVVALLAHGLFYLLSRAVSRWLRISLTVRYMGIFMLTSGYVALIGWPVPALRALIMASIPLLSVVLGLRTSAYQSILIAAVIVLILFPNSWLSIGNWLSFGSVLLIIMAIRWQTFAGMSKLTSLLMFQLLMSLLSLFWSFFYGLSFNFLGFFINLIASPLITFIIFPLAILILWQPAMLAVVFEWLAEQSLSMMLKSAQFGIEGSVLYATSALCVGLLLVFLAWQPYRKVTLSLTLLLVVTLFFSFRLTSNDTELPLVNEINMRFFDVGHGLAVLIKTPEAVILFDTGGRIGKVDSIYSRKLSSLVPHIDALVVSHSDADHSAGVLDVVNQYPNVAVYAGQPHLMPVPSFNCHQTQAITQNLYFIPVPNSLQTNDNDQSCVLVVQQGRRRVILTGDAGKRVEYYLMQAYKDLLPFDAVVLGHHGSKSSSASDWLNANQGATFINSGADMARGHWPATAIRAWFDQEGIELANTAKRGTMDVFVTQVDIRIKSYESAFRKHLIY